jgi:flagellar biosynthesis protein FlhB
MADAQKTEQPTQRRMKKAREEGNFPAAKVFVNALQFVAFVWLLHTWGPDWIQSLRASMAALLAHALDPRLSATEVVQLGLDLLKHLLIPLGILGGIMIAITVAIQFGVTRMGLSLKKVTPDFSRLNPGSRLKELPKQNLPSLLQAAIMIPAFGGAVYYLVADNLGGFLSLPLRSVPDGLSLVAGSIQSLLWKAALVFIVFGAVDLVRQKRR